MVNYRLFVWKGSKNCSCLSQHQDHCVLDDTAWILYHYSNHTEKTSLACSWSSLAFSLTSQHFGSLPHAGVKKKSSDVKESVRTPSNWSKETSATCCPSLQDFFHTLNKKLICLMYTSDSPEETALWLWSGDFTDTALRKIKRNSCESIWFYRLVFHFVQHSGAVQNNLITAEQKCSVVTWRREENTQRTTNMATKDNTELCEGHFLTPALKHPHLLSCEVTHSNNMTAWWSNGRVPWSHLGSIYGQKTDPVS